MKTASSLFSNADRTSIEAAIATAEAGTRGQVVPVVATLSGRYDRAEDLFGLTFALFVLSLSWVAYQGSTTAVWSAGHTAVLGLPSDVAIVVGGFFIGAWLASRFPPLRLPFIAQSEMHATVERATRATFQSQRIRNTSARTGILIYVSLYERMVRILGDDTVADSIKPEERDAICAAVVTGMRRDEPTAGLIDGLQRAGALLAQLLPREAGDSNELADHLIVLD